MFNNDMNHYSFLMHRSDSNGSNMDIYENLLRFVKIFNNN